MTVVVVGVLADKLGAVMHTVAVPYNGPAARNFDVRREYSASSSLEYRSVLAPELKVDVDHDKIIGRVAYIERTTDDRLIAVAEIDGSELGEGPWFYSPEILHHRGRDITLRQLAITRTPASFGLGSLTPYPGSLREAARSIVYQDGWQGGFVRRAAEYDRRRKPSEPLVIQRYGQHHAAPLALTPAVTARSVIETRAATTLDVSRTRRELDLLIAPAETPTVIYERNKHFTEVFAHGAFDGVDPARVKVNRDHVRERVIGRTLALDAWDERGLTGTVKLARTRLADEALALIDDDLLGVSAGFAASRNDVEWTGSTHRRVRRAVLDHISLVVEAAYPSARVTAVRNESSSLTPNLDRARKLMANSR